MAIVPEEWLTTAHLLATAPTGSESDLRRAVSTAYYAVFHMLLKTATERFLGPVTDAAYRRLYRTFEHRRMRELCDGLNAAKLPPVLAQRLGFETPSADMRTFAAGFKDLQQSRYEADYDPIAPQNPLNSITLVMLAEDTMHAFARIPQQQQNIILLSMLLPVKN